MGKSHGTVVITGSLGLLGSALVREYRDRAEKIAGLDNRARGDYFGAEGNPPQGQRGADHWHLNVANEAHVNKFFDQIPKPITAVFHCAAQPAHDWSVAHPLEDFRVNALGTLHVLEAARRRCPEAPFVFASSSKVYGDNVNRLPLSVIDARFVCLSQYGELGREHARGVTEEMSVDASTHSPYGCGKLAADVYVQEYGRYHGMRVACFRPGCITGPDHAAVELHGFLAYLVKCCATGRPYQVFGYGGYQVRDNIHADDLARAFAAVADDPPPPGEPFVTNFGGGLHSNCSMLEAIELAEAATGKKLEWTYRPEPRKGDHMWYVGSCARFEERYCVWSKKFPYRHTLPQIVAEIADRHKALTRETA